MSEPVFSIVYGPSGAGKTHSAVGAFAAGLFMAPKRAMGPAAWYGVDVSKRTVEASGVMEATALIKQYGTKVPSLVIDDASIMCDIELRRCRKQAKGWAVFDLLVDRVYDLRDAALAAGCHVMLTFHEQGPRTKEDGGTVKALKGAPLIAGWQLPEKLPAMAEVVAHMVYDKSLGGWPYVYQTGPDPDWVAKDRLSIFPARFPANMGEALRAAGRDVPRPKEFSWMESVVEQGAGLIRPALDGDGNVEDVVRAFASKLGEKVKDPRHVRWAVRDAWDRAQLRRLHETAVDSFISSIVRDDDDLAMEEP